MKRFLSIFTAALLIAVPAVTVAAGSSADYSISHETIDFGGGPSLSADYANVGSISAVGSSATSADYMGRHGFIGQIHDAPIISIVNASDLTRTDGTLRGSVNPNNLATTVRFEFGPVGNLNETISLPDLEADALAETVSAVLSSLDPGTDYQFRLVASNADGTVRSAIQDFATIVNLPPAADSVTLERLKDLTAKILVTELLGGATDPEGDALNFGNAATVSENGGNIFVAGGWVLYQPPSDREDTDSFTYTIRDSFGAETIATVNVVICGNGDEPTLNVRSIDQIPGSGGQVRVRFVGIPGRVYKIQATESLTASWTTLATSTADASGLYEFIDEEAGSFAQRFYRAIRE